MNFFKIGSKSKIKTFFFFSFFFFFFLGGGGGGRARFIFFLHFNFFTNHLNQKKFWGGGGVRGTRVSEFSLQRIQIKKKKRQKIYFFLFLSFFRGRAGGRGTRQSDDFTKNPNLKINIFLEEWGGG